MRASLALAMVLALAHQANALPCSKAPPGYPCTPDSGDETKAAKKEILDLIERAKNQEANVAKLKDAYLAVRGKTAIDDETKFAACESYYNARKAQDQLYKAALDKTEALYHVGPDHARLTVEKPSDPAIGYVEGLTANWDPQVTDSGPDVLLAVKIHGSDNKDHYGGAVMDPSTKDNKPGIQAMTFEDGRTVILKASFDLALRNKNPGFLAHLLYHESRHFNQLSRDSGDGSGNRRGWASTEEDEKDAYNDDVAVAKLFGLTKKQVDGMNESLATYTDAVANNRLTKLKSDPKTQATIRDYYENRQVNIADEYGALKLKVDAARAAQAEAQRIDRERREEAARLAAAPRVATRAEMEALAARCGYRLTDDTRAERTPEGEIIRVGGENITGFKDNDQFHYFNSRFQTQIDLGDLEIAFLVARACQDMEVYPGSFAPPAAKACNDSARLLRARATNADYTDRFDYLFGESRLRPACVTNILANASKLTDTAAFNRVLSDYQEPIIKMRKAELKRERRQERDERERRENESRGRNESRDNSGPHSSPDHDEVWRRIAPIIGPRN